MASTPLKQRPRLRHALAVIGLLLILLVVLLVTADTDDVAAIINGVNPELYGAAALFLLLSFVLLTAFWHRYLPVPRPFTQIMASTAVALMVTLLAPLPDIGVRLTVISRGTGLPATQTTTTLLLDRLLLQMMRLVTFILAMVFITTEESDSLLSVILGIVLVAGAFWLLIWIARHPDETIARMSRIRGLGEARSDRLDKAVTLMVDSVRTTLSGRRLALGLGLYLLVWLSAWAYHFLVLMAMPHQETAEVALITATAALVIRPPMTPLFIIIYQISMATILAGLQLLAPSEAVAYSILVQFPMLVAWVAIGAWGFHHVNFKSRELYETLMAEARRRRPVKEEDVDSP